MNFAKYLRTHSYRTPPHFCSADKYFTNKIVTKTTEKKGKKLETATKKNNVTRRKENLNTTYLKFSYPFTNFTFFFIPLFSASHDTLNVPIFRNNAVSLRIYLPLKIIYHLR